MQKYDPCLEYNIIRISFSYFHIEVMVMLIGLPAYTGIATHCNPLNYCFSQNNIVLLKSNKYKGVMKIRKLLTNHFPQAENKLVLFAKWLN